MIEQSKFGWVILFFLVNLSAFAQNAPGVWTGIGIKKELGKRWDLRLDIQSRREVPLSVNDTWLFEPGVGFEIWKELKVSVHYRYYLKRLEDDDVPHPSYELYHRYFANLGYDWKVGPLKIDYRTRYQYQFKDVTDGEVEESRSYIRNKIDVAYKNKSMFTPFISADLFYRINDEFDQIRYKAGTDIKLNKHHSLELYGFLDKTLGKSKDPRYVLGLNYKFEF